MDATKSTDGLAVLAAYAAPGQAAGELTDDTVELRGTPIADPAPSQARFADGYAGCPPPPPDVAEPPQTMPPAGEPPADQDARAQVEALFSGFGGGEARTEVDDHERPNVWLDAAERFRDEHPDYFEWAKEVYSVRRRSCSRLRTTRSVRYTLKSDNPDVPAPGERIGEAVLIDGRWKVSIDTSCRDLALAGIECDYSIEG